MSSRVLLLSAYEPQPRPDTDLRAVVGDLLAALGAQPGCVVVHHEVARAADVERAVRAFRPDAVFNACETLYGDSKNEPLVPLLLKRLSVSFTGSPAPALRQCLRKGDATEALRAAGVPVPITLRLDREPTRASLPAGLPYPAIVKPDREDGSVGIDESSVVHDDEALVRAASAVIRDLGQPALVQQFVDGRELAIALLGWPEPRVLPPGEIAFDPDVYDGRARVLTYSSKWEEGSTDYGATRSVAATASPALAARVCAVARRAFRALGMRDYGRVDLRLDDGGRPFVIDVNPNCDLSADGGFMRAARRAGLDHAAAVGAILNGALARAGTRRSSTPPPPPARGSA